ncbi:MAG: glucose-1-phosphate adenylyltransferase [Clostridiales Family XIII bacterium]|jgi:glucose-1-phosphate adenylyltransferase|nr:glucose-1-phosphate adenylyltransferase [Clostridiales Family XIII bacterium]
MYRKKKAVAMLLAGGQGSRLGVLTARRAKPAVTYGGKYRIIDFPLSNCAHSGIDTVGVLTQYRPLELNTYIGTGQAWDLDTNTGGAYVLPPFARGDSGEWYTGTANAIWQNAAFIDQFDPEYVLVLSGDHIYKMNYKWMIAAHEEKEAAATIAVIAVPISEASRFGIMNTDEDLRITEFEEKPEKPKNNLASMGVYVFTWQALKSYLKKDAEDKASSNDFGKNIIPAMLDAGERLFAYEYGGYWKDVGTIESLWEANMELLSSNPPFNLYDDPWRIFSRNLYDPPQYIDAGAKVTNSIVCEGCRVYGTVENSILSSGVVIGEDAYVKDSILMTDTAVGKGARVLKSILDEEVVVGEDAVVGADGLDLTQAYDPGGSKITVVGKGVVIKKGSSTPAGEEVKA